MPDDDLYRWRVDAGGAAFRAPLDWSSDLVKAYVEFIHLVERLVRQHDGRRRTVTLKRARCRRNTIERGSHDRFGIHGSRVRHFDVAHRCIGSEDAGAEEAPADHNRESP